MSKNLGVDTQIGRKVISLVSETSRIKGRYRGRWTDTDGCTERQQSDIIRLLLFFQNTEISLTIL
jgi:hypothetical protein